mmetsp:Transcript_5716/g.516  ORF Transcript_5716/g.516 Transcript_5716/m.516 type:complete len:84 (+) Transcript_5716:212-463(+)
MKAEVWYLKIVVYPYVLVPMVIMMKNLQETASNVNMTIVIVERRTFVMNVQDLMLNLDLYLLVTVKLHIIQMGGFVKNVMIYA